MSSRLERQANKALIEQHQQILRQLLNKPENKTCADCRKRDPRWASANLGIFICLRCSGIHRSLGVHISKVRSVDLDTWTPEHIAIMQAWGGNHRANQYWEHRTPEPGAYDDARIESFIRKKYEQQKWARAESPEVFLQSVSAARGDAAVTAPSAAAPPAVEPARQQSAPKSTHQDLLDLSIPPPPSAPVVPQQPPTFTARPAAPVETTRRSSNAGWANFDDFNFAAPPAAATYHAPISGVTATSSHAHTSSAPVTAAAPNKDVKSAILSLYQQTTSSQHQHPHHQQQQHHHHQQHPKQNLQQPPKRTTSPRRSSDDRPFF